MLVKCPLCAEPFNVPQPGTHTCSHCRSPVIVGPDGTGTAADPSSQAAPAGKAPPEWAEGGVQPTPWERRGEHGLFKALYLTVGRSCFKPQSFWSIVDPHRPWTEVFWYAWVITIVSALLQALINILNLRNIRSDLMSNPQLWSQLPEDAIKWIDWVAANSVNVSFGMCAVTIVVFPLSFVLGAGVIHLGCMLFGCAPNGFNGTARVLGYATAPSLLTWVPQVGGLVGIYILILQVWGIMRVQETTFGRAAAAVLVVPIAIACCIAPLIIGLGVALMMPAGL